MMIPVILLGEARDRHLLDALRSLLGERCAWQTREGIFWKADAKVLLLELSASSWVDVGGGLVVLKESFLPKHLPEHLLHARCILPDRGGEALVQCGLPLHPLRRHRGTADVQHAGECGRLCTNPVGSIGRQLHCAGRAPVCTAVQFERLRDALLRSCPFAAGNGEIKSILCEGLA